MKKEVLQNLLSRLEIQTNTWVQPKNLIKVILSGDGNLYNHISDNGLSHCDDTHLYFDMTNEFLMVKKYTAPKLISSRFGKNAKCLNSYIEVPMVRGFFDKMEYPGMVLRGQKIPLPKVGDTIFTVDPETLIMDSKNATITSIEYDTTNRVCKIFLDELLNMGDSIVCWATGGAEAFNISTANENDESILTISTPVSGYTFDSLVDFKYIGGVELTRHD